VKLMWEYAGASVQTVPHSRLFLPGEASTSNRLGDRYLAAVHPVITKPLFISAANGAKTRLDPTTLTEREKSG
jgi:hypothetical protein